MAVTLGELCLHFICPYKAFRPQGLFDCSFPYSNYIYQSWVFVDGLSSYKERYRRVI